MLSENQQIWELINRSKDILITFKRNGTGDAIASSLALALFLEKLDKRVDIVSDNFITRNNFSFLPRFHKIKDSLSNLRKFIISLKTNDTKIEEFSYEIEDNRLNIFVTPERGFFNEKDIETKSSSFRYDLIIVLETPDLESLNRIYQDNSEFFFQTDIINLDHSLSNENFGQINFVDANKTSCAEILFSWFQKFATDYLDEDVATCLLAGMIDKTRSFNAGNVTPQTLNSAGQLINLGARREEIVNNLFRTKTIDSLKLWGKALANLKSDSATKLVWTALKAEDFLQAGVAEKDLLGVIEELIISAPESEVVVLIYETAPNNGKVVVYSIKNINNLDLIKSFNPGGNRNWAEFEFQDKNVLEIEQKVIREIKQSLSDLIIN